jgi:hypothetical protein
MRHLEPIFSAAQERVGFRFLAQSPFTRIAYSNRSINPGQDRRLPPGFHACPGADFCSSLTQSPSQNDGGAVELKTASLHDISVDSRRRWRPAEKSWRSFCLPAHSDARESVGHSVWVGGP